VTFPFADGFDAVINVNNGVNDVNNGVNDDVILNAFRDNPGITIKGWLKLLVFQRVQ
jgi:hypothetical protein